ncbi:MAG: hypothetical protein ABR562_05345 [Thermoplasmatota archaeon]
MSERKNVARLIRVLAVFVLVPTVTIGGVMLWDPATRSDHWLHASGFAVLAIVAVGALAQAPRIAARFVAENA